MRHEIPLAIGDPFLYVETGGRRIALTNSLERDRLARAVPDIELVVSEELGIDELVAAGMPRHQIGREPCARPCGPPPAPRSSSGCARACAGASTSTWPWCRPPCRWRSPTACAPTASSCAP